MSHMKHFPSAWSNFTQLPCPSRTSCIPYCAGDAGGGAPRMTLNGGVEIMPRRLFDHTVEHHCFLHARGLPPDNSPRTESNPLPDSLGLPISCTPLLSRRSCNSRILYCSVGTWTPDPNNAAHQSESPNKHVSSFPVGLNEIASLLPSHRGLACPCFPLYTVVNLGAVQKWREFCPLLHRIVIVGCELIDRGMTGPAATPPIPLRVRVSYPNIPR